MGKGRPPKYGTSSFLVLYDEDEVPVAVCENLNELADYVGKSIRRAYEVWQSAERGEKPTIYADMPNGEKMKLTPEAIEKEGYSTYCVHIILDERGIEMPDMVDVSFPEAIGMILNYYKNGLYPEQISIMKGDLWKR